MILLSGGASMLDSLKKLVDTIATAKVAAVILIVLLVVAYLVYRGGVTGINLDVNIKPPAPAANAGQQQDSSTQNSKIPPTPNLVIQNLQVTPVRFARTNSLYFRIANIGDAKANNIQISVDLGTAKTLDKEIRQTAVCHFENAGSDSVIEIQCGHVNSESYIDISVITSEPSQSNIAVRADNLPDVVKYSFSAESLRSPLQNGDTWLSGLLTFLSIIGGTVFVVFTGAFVIKGLGYIFPGMRA